MGLPSPTGGSDVRSLQGPGGWHSAIENPCPAPGEKGPRATETVSPGPECISGGCYPVLVIHSFILGPSDLFCFTLPRHVFPLLFPFLQTHGLFFFFLISIQKLFCFFFSSEPADRCQRPAALRLRVRGSCWAIPRRHCFPLCLYVSKGNCTAKAL